MAERYQVGQKLLFLQCRRIAGNVEERPANVTATLRQARRLWVSSILRVSILHNVRKQFVQLRIMAIICKMPKAFILLKTPKQNDYEKKRN